MVRGADVEKQESSLLSHEEIVALFQELEELEQRLRVPEALEACPELLAVSLAPDAEQAMVPEQASEARKGIRRRLGRKMPPVQKNRLFRRQRLFDIEEVPGGVGHGTFSLRLTEEGGLWGFDRAKPKPAPLRLRFRAGSKESSGEEGKPKGRLGGLRARFSRKSGADAGSSKGSGIAGRLKGLGRRRSKD